MNRRRFLLLSATALAATPARAADTVDWQGTGFGAAIALRLAGAEPQTARRSLHRVEAEIARIQRIASLHEDSELTRLNRNGRLAGPSAALLDLLAQAGTAHATTGGVFDPTVQPLWRALATGGDAQAAQAAIGWDRVTVTPDEIRLDRGQALTLNGIAQGWAADRIAALLVAEGYGNLLIDLGEIRAQGQRPGGGPWRAAIAGPDGAPLRETGLADRALATSSPRGTLIGPGLPHILGPRGEPARWSTVAVSAPCAATADALSTAFCLMTTEAMIAAIAACPGARLELAV